MNTHGATVNRGEIVSMYAGLYEHLRMSGDHFAIIAIGGELHS